MINEKHINDSLDKIRALFNKASERIEALKPGERVPATKLSEEIAKEIGMTSAQFYPVMKMLLDNYPGVSITRGAKGGIYKIIIGEELNKVEPKPTQAKIMTEVFNKKEEQE